MDFNHLKIRSKSYLEANSFHKCTTNLPIPKQEPDIILDTKVYLYPAIGIIISPRSLKTTKIIQQALAQRNLLAFVYSSNIILYHLAKIYPLIAPNIIFLSKVPHIGIPLLNNSLNIFTPTQCDKYRNNIVEKSKKVFVY